MTVEDRATIIKRLTEDLIGPFEEQEVLLSWPADVYLSGILWPKKTRMGAEDDEKLAVSGMSENDADTAGTGEEEEITSKGMNRPSTAGISFAVSSTKKEPVLSIKISFGIYDLLEESEPESSESSDQKKSKPEKKWTRRQVLIEIPSFILLDTENSRINLEAYGAPEGVYLHRRLAPWNDDWLVTLTLVNDSLAQYRDSIEQKSLFQVRMEVLPGPETSLIARPLRNIEAGLNGDEEDRSVALLYRNSLEYAVGHTCSAEWEVETGKTTANMVTTAWLPQKLVPATSPDGHEVFNELRRKKGREPLSALWLSKASDSDLGDALSELPIAYEKWIELQKDKTSSLDKVYREHAALNLDTCNHVKERIAEGSKRISIDPLMAEAFRLANKAMHIQYSWDKERSKHGPLMWRPFQLGFILLASASVADRNHPDRETMDLLWFPTGGGKTEAYLALIAFLIFYRRLSAKENPDKGAGVVAVMRYTLRLLTTQQFSRASSMILACETIRRESSANAGKIPDLGKIPFSIGLWVGGDATPNRFIDAEKAIGDKNSFSSPAQLTSCPACGKRLKWDPDKKAETIRVYCHNKECILNDGNKPLPIFTVDDDIYRQRPSLLIGTVDKFAQIPRKKEINSLFSIAECNPPDLIIQDELHLISGPLGTIAGLYEVAIDRMFTKDGRGPKIIGSTATIKRATEQVRALFNRKTCQFPPSAIDSDDSGFAVIDHNSPGRIYAGVTTAGRSAKFTLQAVAASLLQSSQGNLTPEGENHYRTLISYFNSLRELGGALVLMQDDVNDSIALHAKRRKEEQRSTESIEELTSRRTQDEVREMLDLLTISADEDGCLDVVLATNMLSVGVDIPRLGLMIVNGQPKGVSEYIQATSRVGRGRVPGLIISVLNNSKPRDRSHYESFVRWHSTLYRDVEPTSVTPFASRARDKALQAVLVSLIRHMIPEMLDNPSSISPASRKEAEVLIEYIFNRAADVDPEEIEVENELKNLLEKWEHRNPKYYWNSYKLKDSLLVDAEKAAAMRAMGYNPGMAWPTLNNMRSVEPSTRFKIAEKLKDGN